ncbi:hypothetical protein Lal_00021333 [Lupinus albus]|nr:hypothetical protein Lal_00021333 [Lupinus albus]
MVGMRKDPKVGGSVGGTCEVTENQTQHSPSDFDSSNVASFGSSDVASSSSSDVASFGSSDVASFGSSNVANFGSNKVFAIGELTNKVLRCLDRKWQPKVTTIMESKDVDSYQSWKSRLSERFSPEREILA